MLHDLGSRTRGVAGCGRRATYVERCEPPYGYVGNHYVGGSCGWVMDTQSTDPGQQSLEVQPAPVSTPAPVAAPAPVPPAPTPAAPPPTQDPAPAAAPVPAVGEPGAAP